MAEDGSRSVNHYPTVDEILNVESQQRCSVCGRVFQNSSACRFHELKIHSKTDAAGTNEARLLKRTSDEQPIRMKFHCPESSCEHKVFDGLRYLRQHYIRSHAEKKFTCERCGLKLALVKDINYHKKHRCSGLRKPKDTDNNFPKAKKLKKHESATRTFLEEALGSSSMVPIILLVPPEDVQKVVESVQNNFKATLVDNFTEEPEPGNFAEVATQVQMPFNVQNQDVPMYATASTSTSFAAQYDEQEVTFCERGTMMTEEEPLRYFSPPYGAEFGDLNPHESGPQQFDYSSQPSTSQPQTRNRGTMFENVTTCNTGTSMMGEQFPDCTRHIYTQTPNYPMGSSDPSNWSWSNT